MSEVLLEFLKPYTGQWPSEEDLLKLLPLAILAWNAAILSGSQRAEMILDDDIPDVVLARNQRARPEIGRVEPRGPTVKKAVHIGVASGSTATSITIGGDAKAVAQLGLSAGITSGTKHDGAANATRTSLESDYNDVLSQIDSLSKDSSYNGINLLSGDDLKVSFNEKGTSSLTIKGVTFDSKGLGLNAVSSGSFQDNAKIDGTMATLDTALTNLRTQSSKFGSNLSTVQTRQDFTKNLVTTLQSGADNLVLADSNEEGANMLALQTRQQLSTTALSLANQASQAVLRLFG